MYPLRYIYIRMFNSICVSLQTGGLQYFHIEEWKTVNEYHHPTGVVSVYPDITGTRIVFLDEKGDGILYNPVNDECIELQNFPHNAKGVLWDNWINDKV